MYSAFECIVSFLYAASCTGTAASCHSPDGGDVLDNLMLQGSPSAPPARCNRTSHVVQGRPLLNLPLPP